MLLLPLFPEAHKPLNQLKLLLSKLFAFLYTLDVNELIVCASERVTDLIEFKLLEAPVRMEVHTEDIREEMEDLEEVEGVVSLAVTIFSVDICYCFRFDEEGH